MKEEENKKKRRSIVSVLVVSICLLITIGGLSFYAFLNYQQDHFDKMTKTVQSKALDEMKKKEEFVASADKGNSIEIAGSATENSLTNSLNVDRKEVDYSGKNVKNLTLEDMEKVNPKKIVSSFGVGRIEIADIALFLPILEGVSQENLSVGAGTMKANQQLGKGNFALAGHYMTDAGLLFGGIKNVKVGSGIYVTYYSDMAYYTVTEVKHITKHDGDVVLDSQGEGILTLITCDSSIDGTAGRYMVRAKVVN
ncbi:class A sortase [Enterococcus thailandicus]|uniref:class A sortase n=1 Tax=Enterococcus thailandicus TaxID=417368 RepID=UPI0022EBFBF1|nr:class A sortase [Enterococcus thailandicus]MDA3964896.1 class A sortase [Enterococcus thailandicus]